MRERRWSRQRRRARWTGIGAWSGAGWAWTRVIRWSRDASSTLFELESSEALGSWRSRCGALWLVESGERPPFVHLVETRIIVAFPLVAIRGVRRYPRGGSSAPSKRVELEEKAEANALDRPSSLLLQRHRNLSKRSSFPSLLRTKECTQRREEVCRKAFGPRFFPSAPRNVSLAGQGPHSGGRTLETAAARKEIVRRSFTREEDRRSAENLGHGRAGTGPSGSPEPWHLPWLGRGSSFRPPR